MSEHIESTELSFLMNNIRKATEADIPRIIEILRGTYLGTMAAIVPAKALEAFHAEDSAGEFARKCWQDFHVILSGEAIAGLLFVVGNTIESLHIHPEFAKQGYGGKLLSLGERLIAEDHDHAELDVLEGNRNARDFYKSHGWNDVRVFSGMEVGDVPASMVLMSKAMTK